MGEPSTKTDFIVVADLLGTLRNKFGIKEAETSKEFRTKVKELEEEFCMRLQPLVDPGLVVKRLDAEELSSKIIAEAKKVNENPVIVCLDRAFLPETLHMDATRNSGGRVVARYGYPTLEEQADAIKTYLNRLKLARGKEEERGIVLVDIGISEGVTLFRVIPLLQERGVKIEGIVSGITSEKGQSNVESKFGYRISTVQPKTWATWHDMRDMFLIDGEQIPKEAHTIAPKRRFIPYTERVDSDPYAKIQISKIKKFRELCYEMSSRLLRVSIEHGINMAVIGEPMSKESLVGIGRALKNSK